MLLQAGIIDIESITLNKTEYRAVTFKKAFTNLVNLDLKSKEELDKFLIIPDI